MWFWFVIPLVVGIVGSVVAIAGRSGTLGIYVGIVESGLIGTDHDHMQVRAYVDETLVRELPAPSS